MPSVKINVKQQRIIAKTETQMTTNRNILPHNSSTDCGRRGRTKESL